MFTGLVKDTGTVENIEESGEGRRITVSSPIFEGAEVGESISVSGACLTVEELDGEEAVFFLAEETLDRTWFDNISEGSQINLEPSLKAEDRMGGHVVQGHVEAVSEVLEVEELEEGWNFTFSKPEELDDYIIEKGFIAVEGISLTVTEVDEDSFSVTIIPETWNVTNLSGKDEGSYVNIETDITGKYIEKMIEGRTG